MPCCARAAALEVLAAPLVFFLFSHKKAQKTQKASLKAFVIFVPFEAK
jgi:hypothetical protein